MWLLTRPLPKISSSCDAFSRAAIPLSVIAFYDIRFNPDQGEALQRAIASLQPQNILLVTSVYAAQMLLQHCHTQPCHCLAVGKSTGRVLEKQGWQVETPVLETSEGLLALPLLAPTEATRVLLLKGEGGRDVLAATLQAHGFSLDTYTLYRRQPLTPPFVSTPFTFAQCDGIVCTSGESAEALLNWLPGEFKQLPWLTVSARIAERLRQAGIKTVEICDGANDHAIISWITQQWK